VWLAALLILSCLTCQAIDRASWYGETHRGLPMANGQRFNPDKLTAVSWGDMRTGFALQDIPEPDQERKKRGLRHKGTTAA